MKRFIIIQLLLCIPLLMVAQKVHTVKQGETMESIAKQYGISTAELVKLNPNAEMLFPGLLLNVLQVIKKEPVNNKETEPNKSDRIDVRDGSYILCTIVGINTKQGQISIKQSDIDDVLTISTKEVVQIRYANGKIKKYKK